MGRSVVNILIVVAALTGTAVGQARCAAACAAKECANHGSRRGPAEPTRSGCPHNTTPHEKPQDQQRCPQRQVMSETGLPSVKPLVFSAEDSVFAVALLPALSFPLSAHANAPVSFQATKLPLHVPPAIPLRI